MSHWVKAKDHPNREPSKSIGLTFSYTIGVTQSQEWKRAAGKSKHGKVVVRVCSDFDSLTDVSHFPRAREHGDMFPFIGVNLLRQNVGVCDYVEPIQDHESGSAEDCWRATRLLIRSDRNDRRFDFVYGIR